MSSSEKLPDLGFASTNCEVAKGQYPEINPDEAALTTKRCDPNPIDLISCKNQNQDLYLEEVGGLSLSTVVATENSLSPDLPRFIPVIDRAFLNTEGSVDGFEYVGISLEDVFTSPVSVDVGHLEKRNLKFVQNLSRENLKDKKLILFSTGPDLTIESVWHRRHEIGYYENLKRLGFVAATGINFSIFNDECSFGQRLNIKKSAVSFSEYQSARIISSPNVYWGNDYQLQDWLAWLKPNPKLGIVAINCQCWRKRSDIEFAVKGIRFLAQNLPNLHFLLEGPRKELLAGLIDLAPKIHIAMKMPGMAAINRLQYHLYKGRLIKLPNSRHSPHVLVGHNFKTYKNYLDESFFGITTKPKEKVFHLPSDLAEGFGKLK